MEFLDEHSGEIALGKGPALQTGSLVNSELSEMLLSSAKKLGIKVQTVYESDYTHTDMDNVFSVDPSVPLCGVRIPLRYMHSSVEVCDMGDIEQIVDLLTEFLTSIDENTSFDPFGRE